MKKIIVFLLILSFCLLCASCTFDAGDEQVSLQYHEREIRQNIADIANRDGVYIKLKLAVEKETDGEEREVVLDEYYYLTYGANGDLYTYSDGEKEYVYDLRGTDEYVVFERENEEWTKNVIAYSETVNKETALAELDEKTKKLFSCLTEHTEFEGENMIRSDSTVLGRPCDNYSVHMKIIFITADYSTDVDKATGACLKMNCDVSSGSANADVSIFECTEFKEEYTVTVPEVEAE